MRKVQWHRLGRVDELKTKPLQQIQAGKVVLALSYRDGEFGAISGLCNHVGGPLGDGHVNADGYVVCPWHHWHFHRLTGQARPGIPAADYREAGALPTRIFTSPLVRAVQTAEILSEALQYDGEVAVAPQLAPGFDVDGLNAVLDAFPGEAEIAFADDGSLARVRSGRPIFMAHDGARASGLEDNVLFSEAFRTLRVTLRDPVSMSNEARTPSMSPSTSGTVPLKTNGS